MHKEISSRTEKSSHNIREDIHQATKAGIGMAAMLTGLAGTWGLLPGQRPSSRRHDWTDHGLSGGDHRHVKKIEADFFSQ